MFCHFIEIFFSQTLFLTLGHLFNSPCRGQKYILLQSCVTAAVLVNIAFGILTKIWKLQVRMAMSLSPSCGRMLSCKFPFVKVAVYVKNVFPVMGLACTSLLRDTLLKLIKYWMWQNTFWMKMAAATTKTLCPLSNNHPCQNDVCNILHFNIFSKTDN